MSGCGRLSAREGISMKLTLALFMIFSAQLAFSQNQATYFSLFDRKVYSLKNKGVGDFVVDVTSSRLTEQVNEQKIFGMVKEVIFRIHWTLNPEKLAVDVIGLPEGFIEAKNELKASFLPVLDNLLPLTIEQRFPGYKITPGKTPKTYVATDSSGLAPIPSYVLKFDDQDRLSEVTGNKPVGTWDMSFVYEKKAFADGRWVISQVTVNNSESGKTLKSVRKLNYGTAHGIGVLTEVVLTTEGDKGVSIKEEIEFKNYRINTGEGRRYFIGDAPAPASNP